MTDLQYDIRSLRSITRAVSEMLRNQIKDYVSTLTPLFRPSLILGEFVDTSSRVSIKGAERAFGEMKKLYESLASSEPFGISGDLKHPIEILSTTPELRPVDYSYIATNKGESKEIHITSPLRWYLAYSGFSVHRLRELTNERGRQPQDLAQLLLHILLMHCVVSGQPGLRAIFEALHFPISFEKVERLGELPVAAVSAGVSTVRPPDNVILESTFISGTDAFEEVLCVEDIVEMRDPLKSRLLEIVEKHR